MKNWNLAMYLLILHTTSYKQILNGNGFDLNDAYSSIEIVHKIRSIQAVGLRGDHHLLAELPLAQHPFDISRSKLNK